MSDTDNTRQWLLQQVEHGQPTLPGKQLVWLNQTRELAVQNLKRLPMPHRKQEGWRYTSIDKLASQDFVPVNDDFTALQDLDIDDWCLNELDSYRLVFANGRFVPQLSQLSHLPAGMRAGSLREALSSDTELLSLWMNKTATHSAQIFSALNTALINDGLFIHVGRGVQLDKPIEVLYLDLALDDAIMAHPRNLVVLEENSAATLIEHFVSTGDSVYFNNILSEVVLQESSQLNHYRLQNESRRAYHMSNLYLSQAAHSHYQGSAFALGGAWARSDYTVQFQQPQAVCQLNGLYMVGEQQLTDFHLDVQHNVPACASVENFKGILYGKGRAVFDGRIVVEKQAQKSDAHLHNANLLLTRNAEIDTKPQLEIYADDVKCSHGTTVGQLEADQLYYMQSRGIGKQAAQTLLCLGFAGEIIETVQVKPLQTHLHKLVQDKLQELTPSMAASGGEV